MGKLVVSIGVGDQQGRQFEDLEVTVDTGSTFTAVPRALLQRLGVPVRRSARSRLADGTKQEDQITQPAPEPGPEPQIQEPQQSPRRTMPHPLGILVDTQPHHRQVRPGNRLTSQR